MNKDFQDDMQKRVDLALNLVDLNVKAMTAFVESQSKALKEVITATVENTKSGMNIKNPSEGLENSIKLSTDLQKRYTGLMEENISLIRKTGEEITSLISKNFEQTTDKSSASKKQ